MARSVSAANLVVVTTTAGLPCFSNSTESWTLHDVQDPQSADPVMTRSTSFASRSNTSSLHGVAAL